MVKLGQQIPLLAKALHCFRVTCNTRSQGFNCHVTVGCGLETFDFQGFTGFIYRCDQLVLANRLID